MLQNCRSSFTPQSYQWHLATSLQQCRCPLNSWAARFVHSRKVTRWHHIRPSSMAQRSMPSLDATRPDTFAQSHVQSSSVFAGAAAAELKKRTKYSDLPLHIDFTPVAIETSGVWGEMPGISSKSWGDASRWYNWNPGKHLSFDNIFHWRFNAGTLIVSKQHIPSLLRQTIIWSNCFFVILDFIYLFIYLRHLSPLQKSYKLKCSAGQRPLQNWTETLYN